MYVIQNSMKQKHLLELTSDTLTVSKQADSFWITSGAFLAQFLLSAHTLLLSLYISAFLTQPLHL